MATAPVPRARENLTGKGTYGRRDGRATTKRMKTVHICTAAPTLFACFPLGVLFLRETFSWSVAYGRKDNKATTNRMITLYLEVILQGKLFEGLEFSDPRPLAVNIVATLSSPQATPRRLGIGIRKDCPAVRP